MGTRGRFPYLILFFLQHMHACRRGVGSPSVGAHAYAYAYAGYMIQQSNDWISNPMLLG